MSQGIIWKSCTGVCMDISSPAKYFCINCENHDSTYDVAEEKFEVQQDNVDVEFEDEFEIQGGDWESRMNFMEEQMKIWTLEMNQAIAVDLNATEYKEDEDYQIADKEELALQIIHLVNSWHLGIEREFYSSRMEKLRNAMAKVMFDNSMNKIQYLS